jgi:hypothetical protein
MLLWCLGGGGRVLRCWGLGTVLGAMAGASATSTAAAVVTTDLPVRYARCRVLAHQWHAQDVVCLGQLGSAFAV